MAHKSTVYVRIYNSKLVITNRQSSVKLPETKTDGPMKPCGEVIRSVAGGVAGQEDEYGFLGLNCQSAL